MLAFLPLTFIQAVQCVRALVEEFLIVHLGVGLRPDGPASDLCGDDAGSGRSVAACGL